MIIQSSRFTEKKLNEIKRVNESIALLTEMLEITKQQRQLLEGWLPRIENDTNYKRYQEEYDTLLLKERFLNKSIDQENIKALMAISIEKEANDASLIINLS